MSHAGTSLPLCQSLCALMLICVHWHVEQPCCVCEFSVSIGAHSHAELSPAQTFVKNDTPAIHATGDSDRCASGAAVQASEDRWCCWHSLSQLALKRGAEEQDGDKLLPGHLLQPPQGWDPRNTSPTQCLELVQTRCTLGVCVYNWSVIYDKIPFSYFQ